VSSFSNLILIKRFKKLYRATLRSLTPQKPSGRLICQSALRNWVTILISLVTSFLGSLSEGATLGVIFLASSLLTKSGSNSLSQLPSVDGLSLLKPSIAWAEQLPVTYLFLILTGVACLLQFLLALCTYCNAVASEYFGARVGREVTGLMNTRILSFTYSCASRYRVGDLLNYSQHAGTTVQGLIYIGNNLIINLAMIAMYSFILYKLSGWLLIVAFLLASLLWLIQSKVLPRIRKIAQSSQTVSVELNSKITENIQGLRLLHSSGSISLASESFQALLKDQEDYIRHRALLMNIISPVVNFLPIGAIFVLSIASVILFSTRASGILPSLVTFVLALQRLNSRFGSLAGLASKFAATTALVKRLDYILSDHDKEFVRQGGTQFYSLKDNIELKNVGLTYDSVKRALQCIDLKIKRYSTVALVGASGAGKSSIADLLVGLYEPTEGQILVDGTPLEKLNLESWQHRLGVVSQDTFLINDTIAANIAFGISKPTKSQIETAAKMAQADSFIQELPSGYDTLLGERGYRLSGGQRQRISLARALMRDPDLLILDEATSALDTQSEKLVHQAINSYRNSHTVLVIAHRLSTVVDADLICVMDGGQIVESGTHQDLLRLNQHYAALWNIQTRSR